MIKRIMMLMSLSTPILSVIERTVTRQGKYIQYVNKLGYKEVVVTREFRDNGDIIFMATVHKNDGSILALDHFDSQEIFRDIHYSYREQELNSNETNY